MSSNSGHGVNTSFSLEATTQNAHLALYAASQPVNSTLQIKARTSNAALTVVVPLEFDGHLVLPPKSAAYLDRAAFNDIDVRDPAGLGRVRHMTAERNPVTGLLDGDIWWGAEGEEKPGPDVKGSLVMETTVFPAVCKLMGNRLW